MNYMNTIYKSIALLATASLLAACVDKLDEVPDNRTVIDSPVKVASLLTSGYPNTSPAVVLELSGDNLVDDNVVITATHNGPYEDFHAEAYKWLDIENYSIDSDDTPYNVWEQYYQGIAVCNHAIYAMLEHCPGIAEMSAADVQAQYPEYAASWGEAHALRAYLHFVLVNVFAESYKDDARSSQDMGIPYVTIPETTVQVDYSTSQFLHNVKETYDLIEGDLLRAIPLINDASYKVTAYHFNKNAAYAFAARFYLFKRDYDKCIYYATQALGNNPTSMMRKWGSMNMNTAYTKRDSYWSEKNPCNFLLQSTYSLQWRMLATNARFAVNTGTSFSKEGVRYTVPSTLDIALYGSGPTWSGSLPCYSALVYINNEGQQYGCYHMKEIEYFEYTDKIAGIGYVHMLYNPLTAEETLLCRAEAELYMGQRDKALADLQVWNTSKLCTRYLDLDAIRKFYNRSNKNNQFVSCLHPAEMGFQKVLSGDDLSVLDCILHFRRIELLHGGERWFDIKRYGISVTHYYRDANEDEIHIDSLTWDDPRRIIQLPKNVRDAGFPSSRPVTGGGSFGSSASTGYHVSSANLPEPVQLQTH